MWITVDFKPAPPGWRVVSLYQDRRVAHPVAGWLVQEQYPYDMTKEELIPSSDPVSPERRVIPGIVMEGWGWTVEPIDEGNERDPFTWVVLGPGEPEPSEEDEAAERERRSAAAERETEAGR